MQSERFLTPISQLTTYQTLVSELKAGRTPENIALPRAARLAVLAALYRSLQRPLLLITDRADRALTLLDELSLWLPDANRLYFPEPNPLFYERAPWGPNTRRDRLTVLSALSQLQIPSAPKPDKPPLIVASTRAIMARTLPRREYLKARSEVKIGQVKSLNDLIRDWLELGDD